MKEPIETSDIQIVINLCHLLQALFTCDTLNLQQPEADLKLTVDKMFFFCYVWSLGAPLGDMHWEEFNESSRDIFEEVCPSLGLPPTGTAFDFFVDLGNGKFIDWHDILPSFSYDSNLPYFSLVVPTVDTCRFSFIMSKLVIVDKPAFITGVTGTGKTVAVQSLLNSLQLPSEEGGMEVSPIFLNFSAQTLSLVTQSTIEGKLEKKRKNLLGPPSGRIAIIFVDDVNMPIVETYGAQAPVELLRQFLDFKGFYDRDKLFWKEIQNTLMFVAAAPPGGGRSVVSPRFTRHFNVLSMPPASDNSLAAIFEAILGGFLSIKFENEVCKMCKGLVSATIEVYTKISRELLPTPSKFHYTFNLRDISKVFQGILMIRPRKCTSAEIMSMLWIHEMQRIFFDRLTLTEDQEWFKRVVEEMVVRHLKVQLSSEDLFRSPIIFADFLKPDANPKFVEYITDHGKLIHVLNSQLDEYNMSTPTQMNLVFFLDALCHTSRIIRILRQPRGNAMLVGVGGSGKQSLSRIGAFVAGMNCLSIEINRGYGVNEFREDIKKFMIQAGVEGRETVFLFTDSQIVDETMLEDLNNILNTGEIPNLFPQDETDKIISDMMTVCKQDGILETRDNCWLHFVNRVRDRLHIVLAMSPVGDALRIRCRQFPSLINCTTIDWYHGWPEEALISVAERFLLDLELPDDDIRNAMVKICGYVHESIERTSADFFARLRRRIYTTPKSYLDVISLYINMLAGLQNVVELKRDRMIVGVRKLDETNAVVESLQGDLEKLQPILKEKSIETEQLLKKTAKETADAKVVADRVAVDEAVVAKQAAETKAVADDAQKDLDRALPALESAVKALNSLTKADITEVKGFANPPKAVQIVLVAVCSLGGEKVDWDNAKKVMSRSDFMDSLVNFDKDNIAETKLKKLRKQYINVDEMNPDVVAKVSKAGLGLCLWARAMDVYADVAQEVGPKKERLALMNSELNAANKVLAVKQGELKEVMDKVAALQALCDDTLAEKNRLQAEADTTANRLVRAEKLTCGLSSEGVRWRKAVSDLGDEKVNLIGDCFLACACISYYGGFTGDFRDELVSEWLKKAREIEIPVSSEFRLEKTLGDPVQIREWQNQGLPTDLVSISNSILVDKCRRWPLMIDPQQQANKWLRKKEELNNLAITTMNDINLLRTLENCIRIGRPLLLEDLGETIEPALEPVLQKSIFKQGTRTLIRLGDADVDYDASFKLYMTSKLPNPHYLPEVCIKVTLINFTVTMTGLESQLLGNVVALERPDIEERKVELLLQMASDKQQLVQLEATILLRLSESQGNILDDEALINTLAESKMTATAIGERVAEAEITESEINETRAKYTSVAIRGSIIYFVIAELASIDPMYQYSLTYYSALFKKCIMESEKHPNLEVRLENILSYTTQVIYENICRGLFEKDKLVFSSSMCFQILRRNHVIRDIEWNLFVRGAGSIDRRSMPSNPYPESISGQQWETLYAAEQVQLWSSEIMTDVTDKFPVDTTVDVSVTDTISERSMSIPFLNLCASVKDRYREWKTWGVRSDLVDGHMIPGFENVSAFQRLILVKTLREDKLQVSIAQFVAKFMGQRFAESPASSMGEVYVTMSNSTPCIFILSKGADPTGMLLRFAKKKGYGDRLHIVSLGQGQGPYAKSLIDNGCKSGDWVVLQNCMLAKSWLSSLDSIIFGIQERASQSHGDVHPDFRLYLTSSPVDYFPVSILQNGVKMTNEPPRGFRANISASFFNLIKEEDWDGCLKALEWKKLMMGLLFFHANIQERRKFGPLGWNITYAFDESDLETSIACLRRFLDEQEVVPWDALNYIVGHINYGGRVTDDWDRRALMSILGIYMVPEILVDGHVFSKSGKYFAPPIGSLSSTTEYIDSLPIRDDPEVFGMHGNANVTFTTNESITLMATLLSLQPREAATVGGKTSDDIVLELADDFTERLPNVLNADEAGPLTFIIQTNGLLNSLAICLEQEMVRFNHLTTNLSDSLKSIDLAIHGMIVMSSDLDKMYTAFLNNQVPRIWEKVSFASLKSLGSWFADMSYRVAFMQSWLVHGQPPTFPLPVRLFFISSLHSFLSRLCFATIRFSFSLKAS
jgi:dynein heavy chain